MKNGEFVDYYEVMEVSPNANSETIERIFRYFGQRLHPDNSDTGDDQKFRRLLAAYGTLRDPQKRAAYDVQYRLQQENQSGLVRNSAAANGDSLDRHRILTLFYGQRRRDMQQPGVSVSSLERILGCPREVLEFHLWYLREKEWVKREENGLFAIAAAGVDRIESSDQRITVKNRAISMRADSGGHDAADSGQQAPLRPPHNLKRCNVAGWPSE